MAVTDIRIRNDAQITTTITMTSMTTLVTTNARQSAVLDFGATRAQAWLCRLQATPGAAPTAGSPIEVYIAYASATISTAFPCNLASADSTYTGYADASIVNAKNQLEIVGFMPCTASAVLQTMDVGVICPKLRYGIVVVVNNCLASLSSGGTHGVSFTPIVDQSGA